MLSPRSQAIAAGLARRALRLLSAMVAGVLILAAAAISVASIVGLMGLTIRAPLMIWMHPKGGVADKLALSALSAIPMAAWLIFDARRSPGVLGGASWRRPGMLIFRTLGVGFALAIDRYAQGNGYPKMFADRLDWPCWPQDKAGESLQGRPWRESMDPLIKTARTAPAFFIWLPQMSAMSAYGVISSALAVMAMPFILLERAIFFGASVFSKIKAAPARLGEASSRSMSDAIKDRLRASAQALADEGAPELANAEAGALNAQIKEGEPIKKGSSRI